MKPMLSGAGRRFEVFEGRTAWAGPVQVFVLEGHPEATHCYAWSHAIEGSEDRRFVAVLHGGGIDSPQAAVRASIVAEAKRRAIENFKDRDD